MRLFVLGDTHGNGRWLADYIYPQAARFGADAIVQVGDFGFWEHTDEGVQFLDRCGQLAEKYNISINALHGNHDKWSLVVERYGHQRTVEGFLACRPGVNYIPQGRIWTWAGVRMRAFGGAYSLDKDWRLEQEAARRHKIEYQNRFRVAAGKQPVNPDTSGTLWFPEEEMTDDDMTALLAADSAPVDVIFSHDKPRSAAPDWNRKDFPECWPNQDRLQRALRIHQPKLWFHGHLHYRYENMVRAGDDDTWTRVVGLGPDRDAAEAGWRPTDAWALVDVDPAYILRWTPADEAAADWKREQTT